jgi:hypothetical protein
LLLDGRRRRRDGGFGHLGKQQRLVRIDRFQAPTSVQQGVESLLQLGEIATIAPRRQDQFDDHLLQNGYVIRQLGGIDDGRR